MSSESSETPDLHNGPNDAQEPSKAPPETSGGEQEGDRGTAYWKGRARQWEDKAKKNAEAAQAWSKYQEEHKSEEQKASEERAALEEDLARTRRQARMADAALTHGLTKEDLSLLDPSGTDEEFQARAAALAERLTTTPARHRDPNLGREQVNQTAGQDWLRQSLSGS